MEPRANQLVKDKDNVFMDQTLDLNNSKFKTIVDLTLKIKLRFLPKNAKIQLEMEGYKDKFSHQIKVQIKVLQINRILA